MQLYCGRVKILGAAEHLQELKPVILASNHPNSFFDALIVAHYYPRPIHFLARGDVFKKPRIARLLRSMNMIPIHRLSEGRENLTDNEATFTECVDILANNGTVLIFSEGLSENGWKLRPLKKGTARIAYKAWHESNIPGMQVVPLGLTYHSFTEVPKNIWLNFSLPITKDHIPVNDSAHFYNELNELLHQELTNNISIEIIKKKQPLLIKALLSIPAIIGLVCHKWLYILLRGYVRKKTAGTVFYDSVLFACLIVIYPVFLLLIFTIFTAILDVCYGMALIVLLPFTAWAYKTYKQ